MTRYPFIFQLTTSALALTPPGWPSLPPAGDLFLLHIG